ncbi:integral membrane [Pyrenophora seminiperda CCB06]|uniref:Integral membrane n=1 Tax=Pyrenophora seminiperda CCB06 TaxID=1302712 RepID=A0A3M7MB92_9PLEO|nr:integral membrane [Pyrenophora seminiperda CCB06]
MGHAYRHRLDGVAITTYVLVMLLVPLKIFCRQRHGGWHNVRMDDYMSMVALACANGFFYICIIGMRPSLGLHITDITDLQQIMDFLRNIYVGQILYTLSITSIKLSVLAFYWRLFEIKARFTIIAVTACSIAWCIAILLCVIFNCIPVHAAWDITVTGAKCIPIRSIYLGGSVTNVVLDLFIVMLPIPHVWRLHAPLAQRIVLAGMFALGTFIAVVSLVRLIIFLQIPIATQGDVTYNFREIIVWSIVEINIGLTCACLPSLKPAFQMIGLNKLFSFSSSRPSEIRTPGASGVSGGLDNFSNAKMSTGRPRKKGATGGLFSTLAGISRMEDEEDECKFVDENMGKNNVEIEMGRVSGDSGERTQSGGISVQKNWSVLVDERKVGHS